MQPISRREFTFGAGASALILGLGGLSSTRAEATAAKLKVHIFTKHLQFIQDYETLAKTAADIGFDGLDLAVREGAHVLPTNVEKDLPRAIEAARKANLAVDMITTAIHSAGDPNTEKILKTASALGVRFYRIGGWSYRADKPSPEILKEVEGDLKSLVDLNRRYKTTAAYQNHSGANDVGAPIWDTWEAMKEIDPEAMGFNYDLGHATVEGGYTWETSYRLVASRVKVVTFKDFTWQRDEKRGWKANFGPLGEGMIQGVKFLKMLKRDGFTGPITLHFEYEAKDDSGKKSNEAMIAAMRRDLGVLRKWLAEAGCV